MEFEAYFCNQHIWDVNALLCAHISSHLTFIEFVGVMCVFDIMKGFNAENSILQLLLLVVVVVGWNAGTEKTNMNNNGDIFISYGIKIKMKRIFFSFWQKFAFEFQHLKYTIKIFQFILVADVHFNCERKKNEWQIEITLATTPALTLMWWFVSMPIPISECDFVLFAREIK